MRVFTEWDMFRRRHLPHLDRPGAPTFVTFRLADSLPREVLVSLAEQSRQWALEYGDSEEARTLLHKRVFARFDKYLDENIALDKGPLFLQDAPCAEIVLRNLLWGIDNRRYLLHAWSIMPNHVHILIETLPLTFQFDSYEVSWRAAAGRTEELSRARFEAVRDRQECLSYGYHSLSRVMQGIKGVSAREINKLRHSSGSVWQDESFDHIVRTEAEYYRILTYIEQNPIAAGLASASGEHHFTKVLGVIPDYANHKG